MSNGVLNLVVGCINIAATVIPGPVWIRAINGSFAVLNMGIVLANLLSASA